MEIGLRIIICVQFICIAALLLKLHLMRKAAKEIGNAFTEKLGTDTNTLIDISSGDGAMRELANTVNSALRQLRAQRNRYEQGDTELKNAITNISHDLRTPLTAICGYAELLERQEMSDEAKRYTAVIRNRSEMMSHLTEELFRYSVVLSEERVRKKEPVDLVCVLEESIAAFYTALQSRGITPAITLPDAPVIRICDRAALSRVFSNLLNNAVRYSDGDLRIVLDRAGKTVFANTASGLHAVAVGRLFDRYYTVEAAENATGLGLAISRTLIEQMGGVISADYENGQLSVTVCLPESSEQTEMTSVV
ncbi:MAG: sensor histidine kinase [Eubacteriales bacterium]